MTKMACKFRFPFARSASAVLCAAVLLCAGQQAAAQSRNAVGLSSVGNIGSTSGFGINTFNSNSYGLGGSSSSGSSYKGPSTTLSRSSYNLRRSGAPTGVSSTSSFSSNRSTSAAFNSGRLAYEAYNIRIRNPKGRTLVDPLITGRVALGESKKVVFGLGESLLDEKTPLGSFAPSNEGRYATLVRNGELAIRSRQYVRAIDIYRQLRYVGEDMPETYLGLAHANFVLGRYNTMAQHLIKAMELNSEVFDNNIVIRRFFSDPSEFIRLRDTLAEHCRTNPSDALSHLSLYYILYFDGSKAAAAAALNVAAANSNSPRLTQTIERLKSAATEEKTLANSPLQPFNQP